MADIALDADALRQDRQRYSDLLDQAEQQVVAWNERAAHLQQAVDAFEHLLALADDDPAHDGGAPRRPLGGRGAASPAAPAIPGQVPGPERPHGAGEPGPERPHGAGEPGPERPHAEPTVPAPVTPAAPEPVDPPDAEAPRGTDALRLVFESEIDRTWTLAELIAALGSRGWLPTSRRPEEGVRISLKRLAERGGAVRTDDGRWRLAGVGGSAHPGAEAPGVWPQAEEPPSAAAPAAQAGPASAPGALPAPVGPASGGTTMGT